MRSENKLQRLLEEIKKRRGYDCFQLIIYTSTAEIYLHSRQMREADELVHLLEKADPEILKTQDYGKLIEMIKNDEISFRWKTPKQVNKILAP